MAVTITAYNNFKKFIVDGTNIDLDTNTIKVALCDSSYNPMLDTHDYFDDITHEISGGNYTAGGSTVTGLSLTVDTTNDRCKWDATDVTWTSLTMTDGRYGIIYKSTGVAGTSPLIAYINFGENKSITNGTLTITWHGNGIMLVS